MHASPKVVKPTGAPKGLASPRSGRKAGASPRNAVRRIWDTPKITPLPRDLLSCYGGSLGTGKPTYTAWKQLSHSPVHAEEEVHVDVHYDARVKEKRRKNLLQKTIVKELIEGKHVGQLQVAFGEITPSRLHEGRELHVACQEGASLEHLRTLLAAGADPLTRDIKGNVPLHNAVSAQHVAELLEIEPKSISFRNWDDRTPLEAQILRLKKARACPNAILQEFLRAAGANIFFKVSKADGRTPWGMLKDADRDKLKLNFELSWDALEEAMEAHKHTAMTLLMSLRALRSKLGDATEGMIQYHLFEEPGPEEQKERLHLAWKAMRVLLRASSGCHPEAQDLSDNMIAQCQEIGRWLLDATQGGKAFQDSDPRGPYITEYADCVSEFQQTSSNLLDKDFWALEKVEAGNWLLTVPPISEICSDVWLPFGYKLRMDLDLRCTNEFGEKIRDEDFEELRAPSWPLDCNLDAALTDLEQFNVQLTADELVSQAPDEVRECFAWLHARWLQALCESVREEVFAKVTPLLDAHHPKEAIVPSKVKSFEEVWKRAKIHLNTMTEAFDFNDRNKVRAQATPAYFVCDILELHYVYESAVDLKTVYESLEALTWKQDGMKLVKTKNGFHRDHHASHGGYRDLKVWLAVHTKAGPFITEIVLHLTDFYEDKHKMLLAFDCVKGIFERKGEPRKTWFRLLATMTKLRQAEARSDPKALSAAIEQARDAGCSQVHLVKAQRSLQQCKSARSWQQRQDELRQEHLQTFHMKQVGVSAAHKAFKDTEIHIQSVATARIAHLERLKQQMEHWQAERQKTYGFKPPQDEW